MTQLDNLLAFIEANWPDLYASLSPARIQAWRDEIAAGNGRTPDELRQDILKYVVTEERIKEYVAKQFTDRGLGEQDQERIDRIAGELMTSQRTFDELGKTLDTFIPAGYVPPGDPAIDPADPIDTSSGDLPTSPADKGVTDAEDVVDVGVGGAGDGEEGAKPLTILTGEEMNWYFDESTGKWYVEYGLPDSDRSVFFEVEPDQMDALFGENQRPSSYQTKTLEQITATGAVFSGNVSEMEGTGSFEAEVKRVKALALDNGKMPDWANDDPEIMDLVYIAQAEGKSDEWLIEKISETDAYKQRFPGIDKFKEDSNMTTAEAVAGYLEFEAALRASVLAIGGDEGSVTPDVVGGLLNKGYSIKVASNAIAKFGRMKDFAPALDAFNKILVGQGYDPIGSLQEYYDFLDGAAPSYMYDVWEASSMAEAASAAGLGDVYSAEDAMAYAVATEGSTSLGDAQKGFQDAAQLLLRMRYQVDVGQYGIEQDDIIDMSLGQPLRSGLSVVELSANISRAIQGAQKSLQGRLKPYKNFSQDGVQTDQSVGRLRSAQ